MSYSTYYLFRQCVLTYALLLYKLQNGGLYNNTFGEVCLSSQCNFFLKEEFFMVFEKIREILATQFDKEVDEITMDTDVQEDFNADSIDIVDLLYAIEDEFDVVIPDEEAANIKKVGDLVKYIENNQ